MQKRYGTIEAIRFLFCLSIIAFHGKFLPTAISCGGGYLAVEGFFIISGVFLAKKLKPKNGMKESFSDVLTGQKSYIIRRLHAIFPYLIVSSFIGLIVMAVAYKGSVTSFLPSIFYVFGDLLLVQNYGFDVGSATGVVWYLCALFFALWLLYPVIRKYYTVYIHYIAPFVIMFGVGFLLHNYGKLNDANEFYGVLNSGLIRGVAMVSCGCVIFEISEKIKQISFTRFGIICVKCLEVMSLASCIVYMIVWKEFFGPLDYLWIFAIGIVFVCILSGYDVFEKVCDNDFVRTLGKLSIPLYLNHYYWFTNMEALLQRFNLVSILPYHRYIALVCSFISAAIVFILVQKYYKHENKIAGAFIKRGNTA